MVTKKKSRKIIRSKKVKKRPETTARKIAGKRIKSVLPNRKELSEKELIDLLNPKRELDLKIHRTLGELSERFCIILVEKLSEYTLLNERLVKYFVDKNMKGIYVTVNKSAMDLVEKFGASKIAADNIVFLDAVSALSGKKEKQGPNFKYTTSPKDLVELSMALEDEVKKIGEEKKFIILDSISILLVYNKEKAVEKFVHSLARKTRSWNSQTIFLVGASTKKEIIDMLAQFCDSAIVL